MTKHLDVRSEQIGDVLCMRSTQLDAPGVRASSEAVLTMELEHRARYRHREKHRQQPIEQQPMVERQLMEQQPMEQQPMEQ